MGLSRLFGTRPACRLAGIAFLSVWLAAVPAAFGGARWMMVYCRQLGNQINQDSLTIENHLFYENGSKAAGIGVTNQSNSTFAIFGTTEPDGHHRINPLDPNNCKYDIRIYDPTTPTQQSPVFYWQNAPRYYTYITHWMKVSDETRVTAFPHAPVYHYDLVNGFNHADSFTAGCKPVNWVEAPGANSDQRELPSGGWKSYQAQTFTVPPGVNRIVSAMAFVTRSAGQSLVYRASIRQGGPTGPQIGPTVTSRLVHNSEFKEVAVSWGINDVPVTPGQTYALHLDAPDGQGFNVYRTVANNYSGGYLYHGTEQVPDKDMVAVVVGVGYNVTPPMIGRSPASFTRTVTRFTNLPNDTFTITNTGGGTLSYTMTTDVPWLSVTPTEGSATVEADSIALSYATSSLAVGSYQGAVTITAPGAGNSPQQVTVNLTVAHPAFALCDFDTDGDVDQSDFGRFQACYSGLASYSDPACAGADLNRDLLVNSQDLGFFVGCYSGPGNPAQPACVP